MFIRTASERDLPAISKLIGETWHATYDGIYGVETVDRITASFHSVVALKKRFDWPRSEFLVADDGKAIAGMAFAAALGDQSRIVDLHELDVHPAMQGRGIGGMLLQEIEESFFESEILRLELDSRNARAIGFFTVEGFSQTGRRTVEGSLAATMLVFEKSLVA